MKNKTIAQIRVTLGRKFSFEASELPESSLCIILGFSLIIIIFGGFLTAYLKGFL
jgi:hypothetical protein